MGTPYCPSMFTINTAATVNDLLSKERTLKDFEIHIIQHYLDKYDKDVLLVAKNSILASLLFTA